jgi:hypothetical protein
MTAAKPMPRDDLGMSGEEFDRMRKALQVKPEGTPRAHPGRSGHR